MSTAQKETTPVVEPIELTLFSGRTVRFASDDELVAAAVELVGGCSLFTPDDGGLLRAVWPILRDRMPSTPDEIRLRDISRNFWSMSPPRPPPPPSPFDAKVEAAKAEEAELGLFFKKADRELWKKVLDADDLLGSGHLILRGRGGSVTFGTGRGPRELPYPNPRHVERAIKAAQDAQDARELAEEAAKRARIARGKLEEARSRWRAAHRA